MKTDKLRKFLIPNIPYVFIGWAFLKLGTAYRLAAGADFLTKVMGIGQTIGPAFADFAPGLNPVDWLVGIVGAVAFRLFIHMKSKKAKKFRRDEEYGSARWGNEKDIKPFVDPKFENNVILTGTEFLTMNTRPKIPANARNLNTCVIGSSGSGKTRFWLTPQLLQAHSSFVVVDPKGGVLSQVGSFLQKRGYKIKVFNSIDFSKSMHYNPLAYIKNESDILKFVNALISNTKGEGKEGDPFWTKAETLLYCALLGYIIFEGAEEDRNMNTLVDMISGMEVKEDDEDFMNAVDYMFAGLEKRKPDCFAVKQYKKYKLSSGKTAKSILISCGARLAPFDIPQLREIMSYDELELDRMGDRRTATFFCISDTDSTYNFLVALAFSQMFNLLCERADNVHGGRLPHHVRVLWDEAANTGQVPGLEKLVAVIRSREVSLVLLYQQLAQCKAIYDKNAETILGNMDSVIFLGGREASTIKEISENWLGKSTISMQTDGRTRGQSESYSQNIQRLGRELMTPSELATMPGDRCILQLRGLPPFYSRKYDLKQHPNYKFTAEADKKNAFNLDRLINRRRRPGPNEACEVYEVDVPAEALTEEDEDILNYDDLDDPDAFV
ncbi:conjugal transfer protein TraG [Anaerotruncus colihominis]|uniref:Conjugal transfer protein TraG n=1 Tax=Anaerotruncus colihominis TaxID=169435 RepID=A0A1Y4MIE4_9FIRM|nr:type IV secretory system conjugative DNA transfer family protein [Anaerotruncus colihominis]OUP68523.1 conjugal transfer protein TraG [Anaerotruncus colihominis]OUP72953.1 conjugal transfer protein TraG [Anaerotruncus colihominis]